MDTNFIFECSTRHLTSERSERVRYRVEHEKIKSVSTRGHVIFCLLYKQQHQGYFSNFPNISEHFPKISEDFPKFSEQCQKFIRTFPIIFRKFPKMSEDFRRLPKVAECSEQSSKMFRSHRNELRFVRQLNLVNVIAHTTSLLSSHVKISN